MATNTYFWQYVIYNIEKLSKYTMSDIDYRRHVPLCMRVWKEIIKKDEIKKCEINRNN